MNLINRYVDVINGSYHLMKCSTNKPFWMDFSESLVDLIRKNNYYRTEFSYIVIAIGIISFIRYLIFNVIGNILITKGILLEKHRNKFCQDFWVFIFRTQVFLLAWNIYNETTKTFNNDNIGMIIEFKIKLLYLLTTSEYIHSTCLLMLGYNHDKDASIWIIHHTIGIILFLLSYILRLDFLVIAGIYMLEVTDLFIFSKCFLKLQINLLKKYINYLRVNVFIISLFVWCFSRLYSYPLIFSPIAIDHFKQFCHLDQGSIYIFIYGLLILIHLTNFYWTFTLAKVTLILIRKGITANIEDARDLNYTSDEKKIE
ncbi:Ceramide synthase 1 [Dermatophagoides pteronyssinus]|uniref:Ceramide synthase 1 n=1 Tax=Dermatophagoides pteronyssinus TaxID=6956 RepID=A0ABQ8JQL2_DERPT|nr:Ceramide synthase 1 [Dermatophagoides pteronyssinus]